MPPSSTSCPSAVALRATKIGTPGFSRSGCHGICVGRQHIAISRFTRGVDPKDVPAATEHARAQNQPNFSLKKSRMLTAHGTKRG
jgi:hypothetical protein